MLQTFTEHGQCIWPCTFRSRALPSLTRSRNESSSTLLWIWCSSCVRRAEVPWKQRGWRDRRIGVQRVKGKWQNQTTAKMSALFPRAVIYEHSQHVGNDTGVWHPTPLGCDTLWTSNHFSFQTKTWSSIWPSIFWYPLERANGIVSVIPTYPCW